MSNKTPYSIADQVILLKSRGMHFQSESCAHHFLSNISYYRLKGYWWDMQEDNVLHKFKSNTYFEDVIERYTFDRHLRLILFDAIERIEIALRTKMIYHLSMSYGALWYLDSKLFDNMPMPSFQEITIYQNILNDLKKEFSRSQEVCIKDHRKRYPSHDADAWKILEVASLGTLSKFYKLLKHQLPEKAVIAKEMGLNLQNELSSWLEAITYIRNIIAHHSRLWSRNMVKTPILDINNPMDRWLDKPLLPVQYKKPFLIITTMIYLCNKVTPKHHVKSKILELFRSNPNIPIYKLGFLNNWEEQSIWKS